MPNTSAGRGALAACGPRPLSVAHIQWWRRAYGAKYEANAPASAAREPPSAMLDSLFSAIRDNRVDQVKRILELYPHVGFTKCFGLKQQRTALYVASFFARFEVVKLLLARGADRQLCSDGVLPSAVVGYGRSDPVDEMKVRCLLSDSAAVHVLLTQATHEKDPISSISLSRRVHVHFSTPVDDFIEDDLHMENCALEKFTRMSSNFFVVTVRLLGSAQEDKKTPVFVQVPAGISCRRGGAMSDKNVTTVASNVLQLA